MECACSSARHKDCVPADPSLCLADETPMSTHESSVLERTGDLITSTCSALLQRAVPRLPTDLTNIDKQEPHDVYAAARNEAWVMLRWGFIVGLIVTVVTLTALVWCLQPVTDAEAQQQERRPIRTGGGRATRVANAEKREAVARAVAKAAVLRAVAAVAAEEQAKAAKAAAAALCGGVEKGAGSKPGMVSPDSILSLSLCASQDMTQAEMDDILKETEAVP